MIQLDVIQGEELWHIARAKYPRTASLAPSIMGSSKKRSRNDAIRFLATGIDREFSQWVQDNLLDRGHLIESFAKPLAEKIIGKKLYPITAISDDEYLLASYDGLSADDEDAWECKSWNEKKAEEVRAGKVPDEDIWQVVQQLAIGAERCLYMVTDGTEEKTVYCWMVRNDIDGLIDELIAGWNQADNDVANYQHVEHTERPKAEVCIELPALFVHAKGEITTHNMQEFGEALQAKLEEVRAIALVTDQDFSNAKAAAKMFRDKAKEIKVSKDAMLSQTVTIGEAARMMDAWSKDLNETALKLEKDVEREDLAKKQAMILKGKQAYADHIAALEVETRPIRLSVAQPDFAMEIKGKRNYASMYDAIGTALAAAKIAADSEAKDIRAKLAWCKETSTGYGFLFNDLAQIIRKPMDDFQLTVTTRINQHKIDVAAKEESQRLAMQAEADAKAKALADAEIAKAKTEHEAILAAERTKMEAQVRAESEEKQRADQEAKTKLSGGEIPLSEAAQRTTSIRQPVTWPFPAERSIAEKARSISVAGTPRPTRMEMIEVVANHYSVSVLTADEWLRNEFAQIAA